MTASRADAFADRFHVFTDQELSYEPGADGRPGTYRVDDDGDGAADFAFGQPDFTFRELRSNVVLRWEYRPGSTLFVVWSQGRNQVDPSGRFQVVDDFQQLVGADGSNGLAIKVNYWLDL